jgi:intraflagellar transport protein 80
LVSKNGRIEKSIPAHNGAIISGKWSYDGSALLTGYDKKMTMLMKIHALHYDLINLMKFQSVRAYYLF